MAIEITNIGESPARRYGEVFHPGDSLQISEDKVIAYSLMEISRDLGVIRKKLSQDRFVEVINPPTQVHQHFTYKKSIMGDIKRFFKKLGGKAK